MVYERVELEEGAVVQFVAVHPVRWPYEYGQPSCGFREATDPMFCAALQMKEALKWLLHLHHGIGKSGRSPHDDEWRACLAFAQRSYEKAEGREEEHATQP